MLPHTRNGATLFALFGDGVDLLLRFSLTDVDCFSFEGDVVSFEGACFSSFESARFSSIGDTLVSSFGDDDIDSLEDDDFISFEDTGTSPFEDTDTAASLFIDVDNPLVGNDATSPFATTSSFDTTTSSFTLGDGVTLPDRGMSLSVTDRLDSTIHGTTTAHTQCRFAR